MFGVELVERRDDSALLRTPYGPVLARCENSGAPAPDPARVVTLYSGGVGAYPRPHAPEWRGELLSPLSAGGRLVQIEPKVYHPAGLPRWRDVEVPAHEKALPQEVALAVRVAYDLAVDLLAPHSDLPERRLAFGIEELEGLEEAIAARHALPENEGFLLIRGFRVSVYDEVSTFEAQQRVATLSLLRHTHPLLQGSTHAQLLCLSLLESWRDSAEELVQTVSDVLAPAAVR